MMLRKFTMAEMAAMEEEVLTTVWDREFVVRKEEGSIAERVGLCGLCGNTGIIDTRGKVFSPVGIETGIKAFCICPNGRAMKESKEGLQE